ncbi:hypothetical protein [Thiolapillus sp.]
MRANRIVIGYHGCDKSIAEEVLQHGLDLKQSTNVYDWLGHGIYFWENSKTRALEWAEQGTGIDKPAVVGAIINLGNCLDLLDYECLGQVKAAYELLSMELEQIGKPLPENSISEEDISFNRQLDCRVMLRLHQFNEDLIRETLDHPTSRNVRLHANYYDSVRGMFPEGKPLYPNAGFRRKNHIQICIRNPNCILGYFKPRRQNPSYKAIW